MVHEADPRQKDGGGWTEVVSGGSTFPLRTVNSATADASPATPTSSGQISHPIHDLRAHRIAERPLLTCPTLYHTRKRHQRG